MVNFFLLWQCDFLKFTRFGFLLTKTIQMHGHNLCRSCLAHIYVFIFWQIYTQTLAYMNTHRLKIHTRTESHSLHSIMQSCNRPYVNRKEMKPCISCAFRTFLNISLFGGQWQNPMLTEPGWLPRTEQYLLGRQRGPAATRQTRTHMHKCLAL